MKNIFVYIMNIANKIDEHIPIVYHEYLKILLFSFIIAHNTFKNDNIMTKKHIIVVISKNIFIFLP